jgi:hypothetical protein
MYGWMKRKKIDIERKGKKKDELWKKKHALM